MSEHIRKAIYDGYYEINHLNEEIFKLWKVIKGDSLRVVDLGKFKEEIQKLTENIDDEIKKIQKAIETIE